MKKRKRRKKKNYLLLDKSALMYLNKDLRRQLDSKYTMLYPPILFAEIAQHGLDYPDPLFNFKNTINVTYWMQRAKMDLLVGEPSGHYKIGDKIPVTTVYVHADSDREELEKQAKEFVQERNEEEEFLKDHFSILRKNRLKSIELTMNHEDIPDRDLIRTFNQTLRKSGVYPSPDAAAALIGGGNKEVSRIREVLDKSKNQAKMLYSVDTFEKVERWIENVIYTDTKSILNFLCDSGSPVIPITAEEKTEIFNRFDKDEEPHINNFAPYARVTTQLYLTIFLYLVENKENSTPKGALRDFEYLYYATDANVTFISGDNLHRRYIEEIPMLKNIQKNFKFLPHREKDEKGFKEVLNSIGIKS